MLVVLAEVNCLPNLQKNGIYPDVFYTDYNLFKNQVITYKDVTVIVILSGTCRLNKRHTIEFFKILRKYRRDENMGIRHAYLISDSIINNLDNYYFMEDDITNLTVMNGKKSVEKDKALLERLRRNTPRKATIYLSREDKGDATKIIQKIESKDAVGDKYISVIQIPDIKKILANT